MTATLPARPHLEHLKKQAKELLRDQRAGDRPLRGDRRGSGTGRRNDGWTGGCGAMASSSVPFTLVQLHLGAEVHANIIPVGTFSVGCIRS